MVLSLRLPIDVDSDSAEQKTREIKDGEDTEQQTILIDAYKYGHKTESMKVDISVETLMSKAVTGRLYL